MASRVTSRLRRRAVDEGSNVATLSVDQARVRKLIAAGQHRAAIGILRDLAERDLGGAGWVRLASVLAQDGQIEAAIDALKQGAFLHRRYGERKKASVVAALIDGLRTRSRRAA